MKLATAKFAFLASALPIAAVSFALAAKADPLPEKSPIEKLKIQPVDITQEESEDLLTSFVDLLQSTLRISTVSKIPGSDNCGGCTSCL